MNAIITPNQCLIETNFNFGKKYRGKVRECYDLGDKLLLITTDRLSAFDRHVATIPHKGQVLNLTSAWWFQQTASVVPNHLIAVPDPNAIIAKKCDVFPIEFVVRGYITGSTNTSLWTLYQQGLREVDELILPEGLQKNQQLSRPILTPTTKEATHDRPITPQDIVKEGWMTEKDWALASGLALKLYDTGVKMALQQGLILVDTKYEFGRDANGEVIVVDEIHTPDSSRYWLAHSYAERVREGLEPENIDKEFLRLWFAKNSRPYEDAVLPEAPTELINTLSRRYIELYEKITGHSFVYPSDDDIGERIRRKVVGYL